MTEVPMGTEPEFLDDEAVMLEKRGGSGWFVWTLLLLVLAGGGAFAYFVFLPMQQEHGALQSKLDAAQADREQRDAQLDQAIAQRDELRSTAAALEEKIGELQRDHARAIEEKEAALAALEKVQNELSTSLEDEIAAGNVLIKRRGDQLVVDVSDKILFDSGKAELNEGGEAVLREVAKTIEGMPDHVFQIGGHTDSAPVSERLEERYPTNWELSTARATNVVRFLEEQCKVPGKQLMAAGFSRYRPVASNRKARGKRKNRRIEIVMLQPDRQG